MSGSRKEWQIVIVGGGFAGSILARILALQGREVLLVEKARHPRFALGESSTPLAGFCLERLAQGYGLADLHSLAAYGRWSRDQPHLRRGLKRGFTFYRHHRGRPYTNSAANEARLLVAASPEDRIADCHWLRADVDDHLLRQAEAAGVEVWQQTEILAAREEGAGLRLSGLREGQEVEIFASFAIDASGPAGALASLVEPSLVQPSLAEPSEGGPGRRRPASLLFTHLEVSAAFGGQREADGNLRDPGPYRDEAAAVHHLLDQGWMYVLPFDHGVSSVGFVGAEDEALAALPPAQAWSQLLARYPSLEEQFSTANLLRPVGRLGDLRYRRGAAVGRRWLALPHAFTFVDPLFSTGMAWSLVAVERLARLWQESGPEPPSPARLRGYETLVRREADHIEDLTEGAYEAMPDFDLFVHQSFLYFAAASYQELRQRLVLDAAEIPGEGFLGATDEVTRRFVESGRQRLQSLRQRYGQQIPGPEREGWCRWVREAIAERDVIGLGDPARRNLYPVDLDLLGQRAGLLGLSAAQVEAALPRLRGAGAEAPW